MKIFDELIRETEKLLPQDRNVFTTFEDYTKYLGSRNEIILGKEAAYELGGSGLNCAVYNLFTQDKTLVPNDEVVVIGNDIYELNEDVSFAKIAIIRTDDIANQGEQEIYDILEKIDLKKYDIYAKGYMIRTSMLSNREQVRVSKKAIKNKLSFAHVGKMYIDQFKKNPHVQAVKMIFVTTPSVDYQALDQIGVTANKLFRALNHVIADIKMDCSHCEWKVLCDQFEEMKAMHQKLIDEHKK